MQYENSHSTFNIQHCFEYSRVPSGDRIGEWFNVVHAKQESCQCIFREQVGFGGFHNIKIENECEYECECEQKKKRRSAKHHRSLPRGRGSFTVFVPTINNLQIAPTLQQPGLSRDNSFDQFFHLPRFRHDRTVKADQPRIFERPRRPTHCSTFKSTKKTTLMARPSTTCQIRRSSSIRRGARGTVAQQAPHSMTPVEATHVCADAPESSAPAPPTAA